MFSPAGVICQLIPLDVFTRLPLNFKPLLQSGSCAGVTGTGPPVQLTQAAGVMSAACSDLHSGHRLVRDVSDPVSSSVFKQGVTAVGSDESLGKPMWSRLSAASLLQAVRSLGEKEHRLGQKLVSKPHNVRPSVCVF